MRGVIASTLREVLRRRGSSSVRIFKIAMIDGFKILGPMQLVTNGGYGTESTMLYIYNTAFEDGKFGRACAYATVLFVIILIFTAIQRKLSGSEVEDLE